MKQLIAVFKDFIFLTGYVHCLCTRMRCSNGEEQPSTHASQRGLMPATRVDVKVTYAAVSDGYIGQLGGGN